MFLEAWNLIQSGHLEEADQRLSELTSEDPYIKNVAILLKAEILVRQGKHEESIHLANTILSELQSYYGSLEDLTHDRTGIGINFLELCLIYYIYMRALEGQHRLEEALQYGEYASNQWEIYSLTRLPFLKISVPPSLSHLSTEIQAMKKEIRKKRGKKPSKQEILDLLVPENFQPKSNFKAKTNALLHPNPLVSVCIASFCDGPWLKETIDAVIDHAGYENFEVIIVYQKKNAHDPVDSFLEDKKYTEHPQIKIFIFDQPLHSEGAKQVAYEQSSGELIVSLDAHILPSKNFIGRTVQIFWENPEVCILNYGLIETREDRLLRYYYFNEVPYHLNGIVGHIPIDNPSLMMFHKPGLYIRQCLIGTFCIMRHVFQEIGGYLIKQHSWGDKCLGMNAYLYGYQVFVAPDLSCIHKWHQHTHNQWQDTHRKTERFEYPNAVPVAALVVGYFYFSEEYFTNYYIPWVKIFCGPTFDVQWEQFQTLLPSYAAYKPIFWQNAVRSVREYWLQNWDFVYATLPETYKPTLTRDFE